MKCSIKSTHYIFLVFRFSKRDSTLYIKFSQSTSMIAFDRLRYNVTHEYAVNRKTTIQMDHLHVWACCRNL